MNKQEKLQKLLSQLHFIIVRVTQDLEIPSSEQGKVVRKKMAVFTYGVADALANLEMVDSKELYFQYLQNNGLSNHQAHVMVERTCFLHLKKDFGQPCMRAGKEAVKEFVTKSDQYSFNIRELLFNS